MILELARNPNVVKKLRAEIAENVGTNGQLPTYENIKNMKYLTWIINETLRLYPVVPFNVRNSLTDTTLPRGGGPDGMQPIGVPKDTPVGYSTLIMHRRRDLYPEISDSFPYEPDQWVPERWATWQPRLFGGWTFLPFNGGPRICIGQQCKLSSIPISRFFFLNDTDNCAISRDGRDGICDDTPFLRIQQPHRLWQPQRRAWNHDNARTSSWSQSRICKRSSKREIVSDDAFFDCSRSCAMCLKHSSSNQEYTFLFSLNILHHLVGILRKCIPWCACAADAVQLEHWCDPS